MSRFDAFFPGEKVIQEQTGWYIKGFLSIKTGIIILTDKRIAFADQKQIAGGGPLGSTAAVPTGAKRAKLKAEIEVSDIKGWEQPRKSDIRIFTKKGDSYTFRGVDFPIWDDELSRLTGIQ